MTTERKRHHDCGFGLEAKLASLPRQAWDEATMSKFQRCFYVQQPPRSSATPERARLLEEHRISVTPLRPSSDTAFVPLGPALTFSEACLPKYLLAELAALGYERPTPIQSAALPWALSGNDVVGIASTGEGKTLGFVLPAIVHVNGQPLLEAGDGPIVLVLAPTRELAAQIHGECARFGASSHVKTACVYGGTNKQEQAAALKAGVEVVVATPGRLVDMLASGATNLRRVTFFVLDEADRMLEMGFEVAVRAISAQIRPDRQTLMWTATWPLSVERIALDFLQQGAVQIVSGSLELHAAEAVRQVVEVVQATQKMDKLLRLLERIHDTKSRILVFANTKRSVDDLTRTLRSSGLPALGWHGDKSQQEREWVLSEFRAGRALLLVATDIAARGLDVHDIRAVVNFEMPLSIEQYIHRCGRTGRAGRSLHGCTAYSFFSPTEDLKLATDLIAVLRQTKQNVNPDLLQFAGETDSTTKT